MRYQVPQNVQREDTILGPLTLKQLIIAICGLGIGWVLWQTLDPSVATPIIIGIVGLTICLLFVRVNEMQFHQFVAETALFLLKPRVRAWQKGTGDLSVFNAVRVTARRARKQNEKQTASEQPRETKSLRDLSRVLDTRGRWNPKDLEETETQKKLDELSDGEFFEKTMGRGPENSKG